MIKIIEDAIAISIGDGVPVLISVHDSLVGLRNGDPMARIELILWGMLAAQREHEKRIEQRMADVQAMAPDIDTVIASVNDRMPDLIKRFGGQEAATSRQVRPSNASSKSVGEGAT